MTLYDSEPSFEIVSLDENEYGQRANFDGEKEHVVGLDDEDSRETDAHGDNMLMEVDEKATLTLPGNVTGIDAEDNNQRNDGSEQSSEILSQETSSTSSNDSFGIELLASNSGKSLDLARNLIPSERLANREDLLLASNSVYTGKDNINNSTGSTINAIEEIAKPSPFTESRNTSSWENKDNSPDLISQDVFWWFVFL